MEGSRLGAPLNAKLPLMARRTHLKAPGCTKGCGLDIGLGIVYKESGSGSPLLPRGGGLGPASELPPHLLPSGA